MIPAVAFLERKREWDVQRAANVTSGGRRQRRDAETDHMQLKNGLPLHWDRSIDFAEHQHWHGVDWFVLAHVGDVIIDLVVDD